MLLGCFFDELEQGFGLFFSVNAEGAIKNLVAAVFGIDLAKPKYF